MSGHIDTAISYLVDIEALVRAQLLLIEVVERDPTDAHHIGRIAEIIGERAKSALDEIYRDIGVCAPAQPQKGDVAVQHA